MDGNLDAYRVFCKVAELKNMRRAADMLSLTPPTVTRVIRELETDLNCQLFIRSRSGVELTKAGEVLFAHAAPAVQMLTVGEREIRSIATLNGGSVTIAATDVIKQYYLIPLCCPEFLKLHPNVRVTVRQVPLREIEECIRRGEIDFALYSYYEPEQPGSRLHYDPLFPLRDVAVAGANYSTATGRALSMKALSELPLIFVRPGMLVHSYYKKQYEKYGVPFRTSLEIDRTNEQIIAAECGLGYTFIPEICAEQKIRDGSLVRLQVPEDLPYYRRIGLYTSADFQLTAAAREFIRIIKEQSVGSL